MKFLTEHFVHTVICVCSLWFFTETYSLLFWRWERTCLLCLLFSLVNHPLLKRNLRRKGNKRLIHNFEFILVCHQSVVLSFRLCKIEDSAAHNMCFLWRHVILGCLSDKFSLSGIFLDSWTISLFYPNFVILFKRQGHDQRHFPSIYVFLYGFSVKEFLIRF